MTNQTRDRGQGRDPTTPMERAAALAALATPAEQPATSCLAPEQIQAWHEDQLERAVAEQTKMHVAGCERCFAVWAGFLEITEAAPAAGPAQAARPTWQRWLPRPALAFASVAAVAVLGFLLIPLWSPGPVDYAQALPGYDFRISGSATLRGDEPPAVDDAIRLTEGDRFELVLIPRTAVAGPVAMRAFISTADGGVKTLQSPPPENLDNGVVRIVGRLGADVTLPGGAGTLLISVGRPDALPDGATLKLLLEQQDSVINADWIGWRVPLIVKAP